MTEATSRRLRAIFGLFLPAILIVAGAAFLVMRLSARKNVRLAHQEKVLVTEAQAGPRVDVITVAKSRPEHTLTLLGETHPYLTSTLYAKVSGYLQAINVDKGDTVRDHQVLAVIESPETDHQYQSALADYENKRINAQRAATLVKRQMISQQEADQAETDAKMAKANLAALRTLKSYEILRAPFDGVVTARYADPGALIQNAGASETSALPVVTVSEIDRLRTYVYVPQVEASFVRVGDPALIELPDRPGIKIAARVSRTSEELDPKTRTLLTEIDFYNRSHTVLAGSFVQVSLRIWSPSYLEIPAEALVMRGAKPFVAVISPDDRVHFRPITIASDDGKTVRVQSGIAPGERIAVNIGQQVGEGGRVQPVAGSR